MRKTAEENPAELQEEMEVIRRAVIAEGCYPARLVRFLPCESDDTMGYASD